MSAAAEQALDAWFDGRTIGRAGWSATGWIWRGPGYDDGWEDATPADVAKLAALIADAAAPPPEPAGPVTASLPFPV